MGWSFFSVCFTTCFTMLLLKYILKISQNISCYGYETSSLSDKLEYFLLFSFKIFLKTHVFLSGISVAFSSVSFIYVLSFRAWSSYRSWLIDLMHRFCNALPPVSLPLHSNSPCILIRSDSSLAVCLHRFPALQLLALRLLLLLWSQIFLSTNLSKLP